MVVLLNLLWVVILVVAALSYWKWRKTWIVVVTAIALLVYPMVQPSYMPKGQVKRSSIPAFEQSHSEVQDRLLKPPSGEEMDAKREQMIKDGLPFLTSDKQ